MSKQKILKGYEQSREPVALLNIAEKRSLRDSSEDDLTLNKRSCIEAANNNDIGFEYDERTPVVPLQLTSLEDIASAEEDELVFVKGTLTLQKNCVQQVVMKDGFLIPMLERCTITDDTSTIRLTLWGSAIDQVANNRCYAITDVRVKQFNSAKYLTSTPATTFTVVDDTYDPPTPEFFNTLFDAITIHGSKIRLADNYKTWLSCTKCGKQVTDVISTTSSLVKCPNCNVVHPASSCVLNGSVRIQVQEDGDAEPIWLKVFTTILEKMLQQNSSDVTLQSPEKVVYTQLFLLENFTVHFNHQSLITEKRKQEL